MKIIDQRFSTGVCAWLRRYSADGRSEETPSACHHRRWSSLLRGFVGDRKNWHGVRPPVRLLASRDALWPITCEQGHLDVNLGRAPTKRLHMVAIGHRCPIVCFPLHYWDSMLCVSGVSRVDSSRRLPVGDTSHEWRRRRLYAGIKPCIDIPKDARGRPQRTRRRLNRGSVQVTFDVDWDRWDWWYLAGLSCDPTGWCRSWSLHRNSITQPVIFSAITWLNGGQLSQASLKPLLRCFLLAGGCGS